MRESFKRETLLTNIGPWTSVDTAAWPIAIPNHCTRLPSVVSRASGLLSIVATRVEKHVASRVAPALLPSQTCSFLVAMLRTASSAMLLKTCAKLTAYSPVSDAATYHAHTVDALNNGLRHALSAFDSHSQTASSLCHPNVSYAAPLSPRSFQTAS